MLESFLKKCEKESLWTTDLFEWINSLCISKDWEYTEEATNVELIFGDLRIQLADK